MFVALQGSADEEDLDEDDSLSDDSGSEQDELMEDSEYSEKKSQPPTPSPSPPETPRPTRRRRKARSPSCSDDENRPPSPKVITKLYVDCMIDFVILVTSSTHSNKYFIIFHYSNINVLKAFTAIVVPRV